MGASKGVSFRSGELRKLRLTLGLSQERFWNQIGVTQSGGCRYERGRAVPQATAKLIRLVYKERISQKQLAGFKGDDFKILAYLKHQQPVFYNKLRHDVSKRR